MKRSMWNMNNTFKNVNGTDKNDKDPSKRGMITGVGIGVVMYVFTGKMEMVLVGLFLGLMIGAALKRK